MNIAKSENTTLRRAINADSSDSGTAAILRAPEFIVPGAPQPREMCDADAGNSYGGSEN